MVKNKKKSRKDTEEDKKRYMSGTTPFLDVEYLVFNKNIFFFFFS